MIMVAWKMSFFLQFYYTSAKLVPPEIDEKSFQLTNQANKES